MNSSPGATKVKFDEDLMWVTLTDGRVLSIPLAWFPRLLHAHPQDRTTYQISPRGPHWDKLDEDISITGLLAGLADQTHPAQSMPSAA